MSAAAADGTRLVWPPGDQLSDYVTESYLVDYRKLAAEEKRWLAGAIKLVKETDPRTMDPADRRACQRFWPRGWDAGRHYLLSSSAWLDRVACVFVGGVFSVRGLSHVVFCFKTRTCLETIPAQRQPTSFVPYFAPRHAFLINAYNLWTLHWVIRERRSPFWKGHVSTLAKARFFYWHKVQTGRGKRNLFNFENKVRM